MNMQINEAVTLRDKVSFIRKSLFKILALNSVDGMRFYEFLIDSAQLPLVGIPLKQFVLMYYKYIHTSTVKLPLRDIEKVIENARQVSVGPCPCRLLHDEDRECDAPLYVCMRINSFSETTVEFEQKENQKPNGRGNKKSRLVSKQEAVEIMRNARQHGLVFGLESCIAPYENNICACCSCCCIELKLRKTFGKELGPAGPYLPVVDENKCDGCEICAKQCAAGAIGLRNEKAVIATDTCYRCGICSEICPPEAISLRMQKDYRKDPPEPGLLRTFFIASCVTALYGVVYIPFLLLTKRQQFKYPAASPRPSDWIR